MQNNTEQPIPNAFQEQDKVITDHEFAKGISDEELFADEWQDTEQEDAENSRKKNLGLFTVMPASSWIELAKTRPIPKMLFGEFWFEGEVCILFADTNLGKSILAVQIGNSISKGEQIYGFPLEAKKQPVLYFDFELSDKQFENRYSIQFQNHYQWDDNFLRVEINPDSLIPENVSSEDYLNYSLEQSIIQTGSKVLIVDNLTYLKNETEKAKDALPLMKHLKALKNKYGLSILALAHTPKRDLSKPITKNDLQGSKMLQNLCDSSFTIGESQKDTSLRYLKQIKVRFKEFRFDSENVCVCQISKPFNLLQFEFLDFQTEREHLKEVSEQDKGQRMAEALESHKQGHSNTAIAQRFGVSEGAVRKWLKKMAEPVK
jgi:hypothetical protein